MKKSWKSAANFDADIPKFSPFDDEGDMMKKNGVHINEIEVETTRSPPSPLPSAETFINKMSSKIKAPPKYVAEVFHNFHHEMQKVDVKDFGAFDADMPEQKPAASQQQKPVKEIIDTPVKEQTIQDVLNDVAEEQVDIAQILEDLSGDSNKNQASFDNTVEASDDDEDITEISPIDNENTNTTQFKVGQLMNVTIDAEESLVNVNLDQNTLKQIFTGSSIVTRFTAAAIKARKHNKTSSFPFFAGRGRKNNLLERVVPLFILPFLIQSAVVPFMVTMIKLFLLKSLFAGKIAIMLLILGALKNHQTGMYMKSQNSPPYFYKDFPQQYPERRFDPNFEGYKVEGKPAAFVN